MEYSSSLAFESTFENFPYNAVASREGPYTCIIVKKNIYVIFEQRINNTIRLFVCISLESIFVWIQKKKNEVCELRAKERGKKKSL